jgi:hypothetical protein
MHDNLQSVSHKPYAPATAVTWLLLLCKQTNTGTSTALTAQKHWSMRTVPTTDVRLGSVTLPAPEARGLVELILLYICSPQATWLVWFECISDIGFYSTLSAAVSVTFFITLTHVSQSQTGIAFWPTDKRQTILYFFLFCTVETGRNAVWFPEDGDSCYKTG